VMMKAWGSSTLTRESAERTRGKQTTQLPPFAYSLDCCCSCDGAVVHIQFRYTFITCFFSCCHFKETSSARGAGGMGT
jgi:hypothetical protein